MESPAVGNSPSEFKASVMASSCDGRDVGSIAPSRDGSGMGTLSDVDPPPFGLAESAGGLALLLKYPYGFLGMLRIASRSGSAPGLAR